jgi:hypothetical protein
MAEHLWNVECNDLAGDANLYWPCDTGLVRVRLDPLTATYEALILIEGVCVSQPLIVGDNVYVLLRTPDGQGIALAETPLRDGAATQLRIKNIPEGIWHAAATPHEAVWVSEAGQVVASPRRKQFELIAWNPATIKPEFRLGPPHCARDGRLWMQAMHPTGHDGEEGPGYISLGKAQQDWHSSNGARTLTGKSSIKVEQRLVEDPWIEPIVVSMVGHANNEAVVPILESVTDQSLLVLRVDHADGIIKFFESGELLLTRFQVMGQHADDRGFYSVRLRKPWRTTVFVYDGVLYLYHPDLENLPGWPLACRNRATASASGSQ